MKLNFAVRIGTYMFTGNRTVGASQTVVLFREGAAQTTWVAQHD